MAKQFVVTAAELEHLIQGLELVKLREIDKTGRSVVYKPDIDDLHRTFHYYVVQWVQNVAGHK
jgi:hypothetical protein